MKERVYLETSFFRYLVARESVDAAKAARQQLTRHWWNDERARFDLRVSQTVYEEFWLIPPGKIEEEAIHERFLLLQEAELLTLNGAILEVAARLVSPSGPLPQKAGADAIHWSVAAVYECEYLLTWNFKHLNNATIKRQAEGILRSYGFTPPTVCSPGELF